MKFIPLSVPNLKGREKEYVLDAIENEWVSTGGSYIDLFEKNIAMYLKVDDAVACQSGTAGLHLALMLSGVERGDEVLVPTLTFIAAINPVKYIGASPVFIDCEDSLTIDVDKIKAFIEAECEYKNSKLINKASGKCIKAIIVVHVFGNTANMEAVMEIADKYGLKVVEDATEALGSYYLEGKYRGYYLGTIGDFGVYSFNGNKIITTGGGGMLVAKDKKLLQQAKYLSTQAKDDPIHYEHGQVGYNYRMTNLQAALGVAQLEQLEQFINIKERNYHLYRELLQDIKEIEVVEFSNQIRANYWFYSLLFKDKQIDIRGMISYLNELGVQTRPIWGLIHQQKPYQLEQAYNIQQAIYYHEHIINIPCSTNLLEEDIYFVVEQIKKVMNK